MDIVFRFNFYDQHQCFSHALAFYVANINTTWGKLYETMRLGAQKMDAQYGGCHGLTKIACINLIGYSSAEIPAEHHNHVMHAWRATFLDISPGCAVSDVYDVTGVLGGAAMFSHVKQTYEQQQAQQLSDMLSAHITTSASTTAAPKKM